MKLAIVSPFPPEISGIGQYGWHVTRGLAATGRFERLVVLAPHPATEAGPPPAIPGVEVRRAWLVEDVRAAARVLAAVRVERPDVVWFNLGFTVFGRGRVTNMAGLAAPVLARQAGYPCVVTLHEIMEAVHLREVGAQNGRLTHLGGRLATRMLLQADAVCLTLRAYVDRLHEEYGAVNLNYLPHGSFDEPAFLPLPNPHRNILAFGFFAPFKGLPRLLAAFSLLRSSDPDVTLTIAGGDHARYPGYLADVRREAGELPGVTWLGQINEENIRAVFARAGVVALPYTATTGASSVLHRAATYGRPVVVSDLPDLRRVVEEENLQVVFVPPAGVEELAEALRDLLGDRARREAMGRHNVEAMLPMAHSATTRRYLNLFEEVLRRRRESGRAA